MYRSRLCDTLTWSWIVLNGILLSIGLGLLLTAIALGLLLLNERRRQQSRLIVERHRALGLPEGKLVYEDADGEGEPLSSSAYPLMGKPDYIVQMPDGRPVPIELKLNVQNATAPYSNHIVQVAAYCLILEDYFELAPTHGILRYADHEFTIEYTPALRRKVIRLLTEMARCSERQPPPLRTQRAAKCRTCPFQPVCPVGRNK
jgi:CRISPR-associated exonuclease Cas4